MKEGTKMVATDISKQESVFPFERIIHLPDKEFVDWCIVKYSVNRGVFNVIDQWFFDYGLENIIVRRKTIISFLSHVNINFPTVNTYVRFGSGGVKKSLSYFVNEC